MNTFSRLAFKLLKMQGYALVDLVDSWTAVLCENPGHADSYSRERYMCRYLMTSRLRDRVLASETDLVLDVGSHYGAYGAMLREIGYKGNILSIEPNPLLIPSLMERARNDKMWHVVECAVSSVEGQADLNLCNDSSFGSLHDRTGESARLFPDLSSNIGSCKVKCRRLDSIVGDFEMDNANSILLKSDTQGHDRQVISSCGSLIDKVTTMLVECPVVRLYEGTDSFCDHYSYCASLGFEPAGFYPVSWDHEAGTICEVDILYV